MSSDTREKILQAAFTVLSRQGYENASIKDIAEQADVAQGLVHYYFKSKQLLVLAVLEYVCAKVEVGGGLEGEAGARRAFEETKHMMGSRRDTDALYIQLIGVGLHDPVIGAGVREFVRRDRMHVEDLAREVLDQREADPSPARGIAAVVWAAILGIMVQKLVDPEFNSDEAIDALAAMSLSAVFPPTVGVQQH